MSLGHQALLNCLRTWEQKLSQEASRQRPISNHIRLLNRRKTHASVRSSAHPQAAPRPAAADPATNRHPQQRCHRSARLPPGRPGTPDGATSRALAAGAGRVQPMAWKTTGWPAISRRSYADQGIGQQTGTATAANARPSATPGSLQHPPGENTAPRKGACQHRHEQPRRAPVPDQEASGPHQWQSQDAPG